MNEPFCFVRRDPHGRENRLWVRYDSLAPDTYQLVTDGKWADEANGSDLEGYGGVFLSHEQVERILAAAIRQYNPITQETTNHHEFVSQSAAMRRERRVDDLPDRTLYVNQAKANLILHAFHRSGVAQNRLPTPEQLESVKVLLQDVLPADVLELLCRRTDRDTVQVFIDESMEPHWRDSQGRVICGLGVRWEGTNP
jgi:hypothetical protein